jgi:heme/copper-type cytochrome/quinol oxidase subunit 3
MTPTDVLNVSGLPSFAFGRRDPRWLAVLLLIAIEGSVFGLVLFAYFYLRLGVQVWPPTTPGPTEIAFGGAIATALVASAVTTHFVNRSAYVASLTRARFWLLLTTVLSAAALALRAVELTQVPFRWDSNAFGSVFWAALCLHTMHLIAGTVENALFLALLYLGPIEKKHLVDLEVNGIYWYFVVLSWLPLYAILYLSGALGW